MSIEEVGRSNLNRLQTSSNKHSKVYLLRCQVIISTSTNQCDDQKLVSIQGPQKVQRVNTQRGHNIKIAMAYIKTKYRIDVLLFHHDVVVP